MPDKPNARGNLGLGSMATAVAGTGAAQFRTNLQNEAFFQPLAAGLTSWAAIARAAGFDTFAATPSSANLRALLSDETGTGALLFAGGAMGTPSSLDLTNATGLTTSGIAAGSLTTAGEGIAANNVDTQVPTSAAVKAYADSVSPVRAWVNFRGGVSSGTYSRTGTTVTVTLTGHGMSTGQGAFLDFTSGGGTDGFYTVTVVNANTFTVVDSVSGATSGNVDRTVHVRSSFNVSSVTRAAAGGDYTINFASAMPDANYCAVVTAGGNSTLSVGNALVGWAAGYTTTSLQIGVSDNNTDANGDSINTNVAIFR